MAATKIINWTVYVLKCPRTREVRYVGWTSRPIEKRLRDHLRDAFGGPRVHRNNWIMSLVSIGLIPEIEAIESGTGDTWQEAERRWIAAYRARSARLVNGTDGGEGVIGWGTPEQRSEMARRAKAACTPEQRSESARKANAAYLANTTPEQRSAVGRKGVATRAARGQVNPLLAATPEQRRDRSRKAKAAHLASTTHEQRSAAARKSAATRVARGSVTPEQQREWCRAAASARLANTTHEQRSASAKKAAATRAKKQAALGLKRVCWLSSATPEQRSEWSRKARAGVTPEKRNEALRKARSVLAARRRA